MSCCFSIFEQVLFVEVYSFMCINDRLWNQPYSRQEKKWRGKARKVHRVQALSLVLTRRSEAIPGGSIYSQNSD
jgi:hypothetical protein